MQATSGVRIILRNYKFEGDIDLNMLMDELRRKPVGWLRSIDKSAPAVSTGESLKEAAKKLNDDHRVLPIVDTNQKVVSAVSQSDITDWIAKHADANIDVNTTVDRITPGGFVEIKQEDTIDYLINQIMRNKFDQVVVLDKTGKFYGIIDRNRLADEIEEVTS